MDPEKGTVRLPSAGWAIAIYAIVTFVSAIPTIFFSSIVIGMLRFEPFLVASLLAVPAVFVAALSINRYLALLVPLVGGLFIALANYYALTKSAPFGRDFAPITDRDFHHGLWWTFRFVTLPQLLATALGLLLAYRQVEFSEDSHSRLRLPSPQATVAWSIAALSLMAAAAIFGFEVGGSSMFTAVGVAILMTPGAIALFAAPAILYRESAAWFVIFPLSYEYYGRTRIGACDFTYEFAEAQSCWPSFQPDLIARLLIPHAIIIGIGYAAGWWARRPDTGIAIAHSGGDSISSSKLPAGSRT